MTIGKNFEVGDRVRIDPRVLENFYVADQKKLTGREGVIEHKYTPFGSNRPRYAVKWGKRGNRGKEFTEHHSAGDLELML